MKMFSGHSCKKLRVWTNLKPKNPKNGRIWSNLARKSSKIDVFYNYMTQAVTQKTMGDGSVVLRRTQLANGYRDLWQLFSIKGILLAEIL